MEKEVIANNDQYVDRYVAFLDLLGFKNTLKIKSCPEILEIFSKLKNPLGGVYIGTGIGWEPLIDKEAVEKVKMKIISDSICFYIDAVETNAFATLMSVCLLFQVSMSELAEPIILRGGIVRGNL